jgi:hypothetical protein
LGNENSVALGTFEKKSMQSDHIYYAKKIVEYALLFVDDKDRLVVAGLPFDYIYIVRHAGIFKRSQT